MQVTLEKNGELNGRIKVEVTLSDYAEKVNKELKEIGRTHVIPGFRKGHINIDQLRRRFGKEVKSRVLNDEVYRAVINYLRDNKVAILGEPLPVEVKEVNLDQDDYTFEYEVGLAPEINVTLDKTVTIPYYNIEVTKEMVDEQDKMLLRRFGAQVPGEVVDETALVKGSIMELNPDGSVKTDADAIQVIAGIVSPQHFTDKEQATLFLGKKVGDKVVFNPAKTCNGNVAELASMLQVSKEVAENITADFEMTISEIIVLKLAEHNEDLYTAVFPESVKVTNEEGYFAELKKMVAAQLAPNSEYLFEQDGRKVLMEKFGQFELPAEFLKKWLVAANDELTPENIDAEYEKMVPSIRWELLSGKINEQLNIEITNDDMINYAKGIAYQQFAQFGMTNMDDETLTNYAKRILQDKDTARRIHNDLQGRKLFNAVRALVTVDNKTVSLEEFRKLAAGE